MKRFLALIAAFLFLFVMIAPVFSLAATAPYSFVSSVSKNSLYYNCIVYNSTDTSDLYTLGYQCNANVDTSFNLFKSQSGIAALHITFSNGSPNSTVSVSVQSANLISGEIRYTNESVTLDSNGSANLYRYIYAAVCPVYFYILKNMDTVVSVNNQDLIFVDPFVYFPTHSSDFHIYSNIPEPTSDGRHFYIADYQFLYEIVLPYSDITYYNYSPNDNTGLISDGYYVTYNMANDIFNVYIARDQNNISSSSFKAFIYRYVLSSGDFVELHEYYSSNNRITIPISLSYDWDSYGLYISPYVDDLVSIDISLLPVVWSEGSSIHSDFLSVNALLNTINYNTDNIESYIQTINSNILDFISLAQQYYTWCYGTYWNFLNDSWYALIYNLAQIYVKINDTYNFLNNYIYPDLHSIKESIVDHTESQPDTSAFEDSISEYEEGESYVVNQAEVALDNLESQMSGAADVLTVNSRGLLFVKNIFETFAFSGMNYYYILFVLVLGSVALLIGRRLR